jgi:hypothetical protein
MRIFSIIVLLSAFAASAMGQGSTTVLAEIISSNEKIVTGAPFSAVAISENVLTLPDGNTITRRAESRLYRDSRGRFRREEAPKQLGIPGAVIETPETITITDPVSGLRYMMDPQDSIFRQSDFREPVDWQKTMAEQIRAERGRIEVAETKLRQDLARQEKEEKEQQSLKGQSREAPARRQEENKDREREIAARKEELAQRKTELNVAKETGIDPDARARIKSDPNSKIESLGIGGTEGIITEGTRITTTIRAGAIGNEAPIKIVYEMWYSPELQLILVSKNIDPRLGVQTYRLTNINRSEPPISLFSPPA